VKSAHFRIVAGFALLVLLCLGGLFSCAYGASVCEPLPSNATKWGRSDSDRRVRFGVHERIPERRFVEPIKLISIADAADNRCTNRSIGRFTNHMIPWPLILVPSDIPLLSGPQFRAKIFPHKVVPTNHINLVLNGGSIVGNHEHRNSNNILSCKRRIILKSECVSNRCVPVLIKENSACSNCIRGIIYPYPWSNRQTHLGLANSIGSLRCGQLLLNKTGIINQGQKSEERDGSAKRRNLIKSRRFVELILSVLLLFGVSVFFLGMRLNSYGIHHSCFAFHMGGWWIMVLGIMLALFPFLILFAQWARSRIDNTVPQEYQLTSPNYWGTVMAIGRTQMANVLPMEKKVAVISALAEGAGIRQTERMTGVNRETIMHLGVRVGKGCAAILDQKMRGLSCQHLQFDEIWGFIGKKERHVRPDDDPTLGDVWTFCAIDSDTKLVPSFKVGKRDTATANAFVADVKSRMANRVQISSDALRAYVDAIELSFGSDVDFAQIIKTYTHDDSIIAERKFSAPEVVTTEKRRIVGRPNMRLASTSHIERLNGTTRLHMRRLTRLTYAFSKKLENFEAATALHFAYYNFVKRHNTLRVTPAMEAGIERDFWTVENLVETAA